MNSAELSSSKRQQCRALRHNTGYHNMHCCEPVGRERDLVCSTEGVLNKQRFDISDTPHSHLPSFEVRSNGVDQLAKQCQLVNWPTLVDDYFM